MIRPASRKDLLSATCLLAGFILTTAVLATTPSGQQFTGTVTKVIDGDTVRVTVPAWVNTPWDPVELRINGIDTPETRLPPAKCRSETVRGKAASAFAKTLLKPGDTVSFIYRSIDKYGDRLDVDLLLPDGRGYAQVLLESVDPATGQPYARPYNGRTKPNWCK